MRPLLVGLACLLCTAAAFAEPYTYLTTVAKPGDGAYALLRRFDLPTGPCHYGKFLHLNDLSEKQPVRAGVEYRVPVLVYDYDGRSIRSTLGIRDLDLAKRIQAYNRACEKRGQQTSAYEESRSLWVPYGLLFCEGMEGGAGWTDPAEDLARQNTDRPLHAAPAEAEAITVSLKTTGASAESADRVDAGRPAEKATTPAARPGGFAIFGERYATVARKDAALAGKVFYLVSGHGGPDPGAIGSKRDNALCEDEYAYDVVLRLARNIIERGGVPYVIVRDADDGIRDDEYLDCDYDEQVWGDLAIPRDQRARLRQRSDAINVLAKKAKSGGVKDQYCIVVHVDSRHEETQTDLFFYHQKRNKKSKALTEELRNTMDRNYRRNGRTREYKGAILTRDLHMLREVDVPTVYIEIGNIQHAFDQKRVLRPTNRQALANWWTEGIVRALD